MTQTIFTDKDNVPMRIYVGVKNDWQISMFDDEGEPLDATGFLYFCQVWDKAGETMLATMDMDLTDIATGIIVMGLTAANSALIGEHSGVYDVLQQEEAVPENIVRLYGGDVELVPVITKVE